MPRPGGAVAPSRPANVDANGEVLAPENGAGAESEKPKRQYTKREVTLPEGVAAGYAAELVEEVPPPPKKRGGRGRGPDARIPELIKQVTDKPGTWFYLGNFKSASSPEGPWKAAGIKFRHADYVHEDGTVVEGLYKRYATLVPKPEEGELPSE